METVVTFPAFKKLVNIPFVNLYNDKSRYIFLWGGRDAGKSVAARRKLIIRCLNEKYFRYILIRKVFGTIKDSQYQGLKDDIYNLGLGELFEFKVAPLEINCINGNKFLCRGLDKPESIKSVQDPTGAWYEEGNQITEDDFITVTTSIRSSNADYLQELFSFNPECDENFEDFWLYQRFFKNRVEKNFSDKVKIDLPDNKYIESNYSSIHSTYKDNPYCTGDRIALLEGLKHTNPYYYNIFTLGEWGNRDVTGRFWKCFDRTKHVSKRTIDLNEPIYISFDENVNPYPALSIWQIKGKELRQIHEICLKSPENKLKSVARAVSAWLRSKDYKDLIYITGDATSDREDTKLEKGVNYFSMLQQEIETQGFQCRVKKNQRNPSVALSGEFINAIYDSNYEGWSIVIDENCKNSINDYIVVQEDTEGKMKKPKDSNGWEVAGHLSDTKRYVLVTILANEFQKYQRGPERLDFTVGRNIPKQVY